MLPLQISIGILAGQYFDQETGLHYNYHRYYDPATGRYLTPDPIGLAGGVNLFAYSYNNPLNLIDPWGLYPGQMPPSPPGYNPDTWATKANPNGKWEVYDPDTGKRWVAHPEDEKHWRHWDDPDKKALIRDGREIVRKNGLVKKEMRMVNNPTVTQVVRRLSGSHL